jgi:hypothetical protein
MTDDGGVLGNLPRSRPGRRSAKREAAPGASKAAASAPRSKAAASAPRSAPGAPGSAARSASPASASAPVREADPVGGALRTVGGLAATGARVANGVAREVLRRLPRP